MEDLKGVRYEKTNHFIFERSHHPDINKNGMLPFSRATQL